MPMQLRGVVTSFLRHIILTVLTHQIIDNDNLGTSESPSDIQRRLNKSILYSIVLFMCCRTSTHSATARLSSISVRLTITPTEAATGCRSVDCMDKGVPTTSFI